jgi:glycosyltransferase involved in cell wall biosynthesis
MNIGLFIPAYQAQATLDDVFRRIPTDLWSHVETIVVVDDGCTDGTAEVIDRWRKRDSRIACIRHPVNQGYGCSVRDGLEALRSTACEVGVCLHADGQYPPEQVLALAQRMRERRLDLLQGSRHLAGGARSGGMPLYKIAAGRILVALENLVFRAKLTDYHSGFLLYSRRALDEIPFHRLGRSFDFDLQVIACSFARGLSVGEEAIPTRYADEISHLNPFWYGIRVLRVVVKYLRGDFHRLCGIRATRNTANFRT